jgi:hypothetical protein
VEADFHLFDGEIYEEAMGVGVRQARWLQKGVVAGLQPGR